MTRVLKTKFFGGGPVTADVIRQAPYHTVRQGALNGKPLLFILLRP